MPITVTPTPHISASWALQKAVHVALTNASALTILVGGVRIFDEVPRAASMPYITHGESIVRDWSTGSDAGHEHSITVHVWSRGAGRKQAHEILGCIEQTLDQQHLPLDGHRLISLRHEYSEVRRDSDGETWRGLLRLHATTEVVV
jgi:Protein of unknown function (DUF3168)